MTTETTWFSTKRTLCCRLLNPDAVPMDVFQDRDERKGERMNRRQFAGVLGISGLSAASYSLIGGHLRSGSIRRGYSRKGRVSSSSKSQTLE